MNEYTYEVIAPTFEGGATIIKRTDQDGNEAWIPENSENSDYQAYLKSLEPATETKKK